jgi:hypothetical protein
MLGKSHANWSIAPLFDGKIFLLSGKFPLKTGEKENENRNKNRNNKKSKKG